jgi:hypothetical protein
MILHSSIPSHSCPLHVYYIHTYVISRSTVLSSAARRPSTPQSYANRVPAVRVWNARTSHTFASRASPAVPLLMPSSVLCRRCRPSLFWSKLPNPRRRVGLLLLVDLHPEAGRPTVFYLPSLVRPLMAGWERTILSSIRTHREMLIFAAKHGL